MKEKAKKKKLKKKLNTIEDLNEKFEVFVDLQWAGKERKGDQQACVTFRTMVGWLEMKVILPTFYISVFSAWNLPESLSFSSPSSLTLREGEKICSMFQGHMFSYK